MFVKCEHLSIIYWFRCFVFYALTSGHSLNILLANFLNGLGHGLSGLGRVDLKKVESVHRSTRFLLRVKKVEFGLGIFWVGSGQKILTRFAISTFTHRYVRV